MRYVAQANSNIEVDYVFDQIPVPGYPTASLIDADDNIVLTAVAVASVEQNKWVATITVPSISSDQQLIWFVRWMMNDGQTNYVSDIPLYIDPDYDNQTGDIVMVKGSLLSFSVPRVVHELEIKIFKNNDQVFATTASDTDITQLLNSSYIKIALDIDPSIVPYLVMAENMMFNLWIVSPRMLTASMAIESWINKAKTVHAIPALEYKQSDLLNYLERGLNLFNSWSPQMTSFNGINMQGPVYEMWLLCSTYYALGAQLQAEGALAFDFSGQAISLNVYRTGQIESALGRIESMIGDKVPALKRLLSKYGINGGDGSQSVQNMNPVGIGRLGITNAACVVGNAWNRGQNSRNWI